MTMKTSSPAPVSMLTKSALKLDFSAAIGLIEQWDDVDSMVPAPTGYRILVAMPTLMQKTAGGVYIPQNTLGREETASLVSLVVDLGPDAYSDKSRFPSGPYCKPGDFVVTRSYAGTRMKFREVEFRFINDDSVEGIVEDPTEVQRA